MRVTSQKTRQFLLVTGDPLDPDELPEKLQLFDEDGLAISFGGSIRRDIVKSTGVLSAAADTGKLDTRLHGGQDSDAMDISKGFLLMKAVANRPCRIRFYTTSAHRDADLARDRFTDPMDFGGPNAVPNHGVTSELLLLSSLTQDVTPAHYIWAEDGTSTIYYTIDNYDLAAGVVTLTLTIKDVES